MIYNFPLICIIKENNKIWSCKILWKLFLKYIFILLHIIIFFNFNTKFIFLNNNIILLLVSKKYYSIHNLSYIYQWQLNQQVIYSLVYSMNLIEHSYEYNTLQS